MTGDVQGESMLRPRWRRVRRLLLASLATLPSVLLTMCVVFLVLTALGQDGFPWWTVVPVLGAAAPMAAVLWWLRRRGVLEPSAWLASALLTAGGQILLGVIPGFGIAVNSSSGAGKAMAGVLFALSWAVAATSCLSAHRAHRVLLTPLVPELGATALRIPLAARFAITTPALISARVEIGSDGIEWSARHHRGRSAGPRVDAAIPFSQLRHVTPVMLPSEPALRPWLTLADGNVLYAQPGPAVLLATSAGEWMIPVHDAGLFAALVNRRRAWWDQRQTRRG